MFCEEVKTLRKIMGRFDSGTDLLEQFHIICQDYNIKLGHLRAIGAVKKACIGYYNQDQKEYVFHSIDHPLEITSLTGNVSLKDKQPFVHAHINLADEKGRVFGGHLAPGTIVFACEFMFQVFEGSGFERELDQDTGLMLWK